MSMVKLNLQGTTPSAAIRTPASLITAFYGSSTAQNFDSGNVTIQVSPDGDEWFDLDDSVKTEQAVVNVWCDAPYYRFVASGAAADIDVWGSGSLAG